MVRNSNIFPPYSSKIDKMYKDFKIIVKRDIQNLVQNMIAQVASR